MIRLAELQSATGKVFLTIDFDTHKKWIYCNWFGYAGTENVKQGALAVLDAYRLHATPYMLNDNSQLVGRWDDSVDWIEETWMPQAISLGLRYFAHVANQESFAAASATDMLRRSEGMFQMQIFGDLGSAEAWLQECQEAEKTDL
jgi:hypothetical protein